MIYIVFALLAVTALAYWRAVKRYLNPWTLTLYIAKKGGGKSCALMREIYRHKKKGWHIYSTDRTFPADYVPFSKIGVYDFPNDGKTLLVIDELGALADNREFKKFSATEGLRDFFIYQRHKKIKVVAASQNYCLIDKKIRELTDDLFLLKSTGVCSLCYPVRRRLTISDPVGDEPSTIVSQLVKGKIPRVIRWGKYIKLYDSYCDKTSSVE